MLKFALIPYKKIRASQKSIVQLRLAACGGKRRRERAWRGGFPPRHGLSLLRGGEHIRRLLKEKGVYELVVGNRSAIRASGLACPQEKDCSHALTPLGCLQLIHTPR